MSLNDINSLSHTKSYEVELQISHSVCAEIPKKGILLLLFNRCMCFSVFLHGSGFLFALIIQHKGGM